MTENPETIRQQVARLTSYEHCILLGCVQEYGHEGPHDRQCSCWMCEQNKAASEVEREDLRRALERLGSNAYGIISAMSAVTRLKGGNNMESNKNYRKRKAAAERRAARFLSPGPCPDCNGCYACGSACVCFDEHCTAQTPGDALDELDRGAVLTP